jgi:hypothetical protein
MGWASTPRHIWLDVAINRRFQMALDASGILVRGNQASADNERQFS